MNKSSPTVETIKRSTDLNGWRFWTFKTKFIVLRYIGYLPETDRHVFQNVQDSKQYIYRESPFKDIKPCVYNGDK